VVSKAGAPLEVARKPSPHFDFPHLLKAAAGGGMARLRLPRLPFVHSNAGDAAIQEELRCSDERQERAVRKRTDHPHRPLGSRVQ
jgi:hypothetical protein